MSIIGTYAYFQLEALCLYQIYCDFHGSFYNFTVLSPLQYWYHLKGQSLLYPLVCLLSAGQLFN